MRRDKKLQTHTEDERQWEEVQQGERKPTAPFLQRELHMRLSKGGGISDMKLTGMELLLSPGHLQCLPAGSIVRRSASAIDSS